MNYHDYVKIMPTLTRKLTKRDASASHKVRRELGRPAKSMFKRMVLAKVARLSYVPEQLEVHHIVPLMFYEGDNTIANLAVIERPLHRAIHKMIDAQIADMAVNEKKFVKIPILEGDLWLTPMRVLPQQPQPLRLLTFGEAKAALLEPERLTAAQWARLAELQHG